MAASSFWLVDVFSHLPFRGNPVAVWQADDEPTPELMQRFAAWTNLSETTFLLPPSSPEADYRVRIFTATEELPFAGHPTLGTCAAWLAAGGVARTPGTVVQECGAGLVRVRVDGETLAFAAPPLTRSGAPEPDVAARALAALGLAASDVVAMSWLVNGPQWLGVLLRDAEAVLALRPPRPEQLDGFELGVIGPWHGRGEADYEVRAFCPELGVGEDPVTGSLNAGLAPWLMADGHAPARYTVAQGAALGRAGRLTLHHDGTDVWVGGAAVVRAAGTLAP